MMDLADKFDKFIEVLIVMVNMQICNLIDK